MLELALIERLTNASCAKALCSLSEGQPPLRSGACGWDGRWLLAMARYLRPDGNIVPPELDSRKGRTMVHSTEQTLRGGDGGRASSRRRSLGLSTLGRILRKATPPSLVEPLDFEAEASVEELETIRQIRALPLEIYIATNWECNYNCTYCFSQKPRDKSEYRPHSGAEWEVALRSIFRTYGRCRVTLTGGEPLLYEDAVDLTIKATEFHCLSVGTNLSSKATTLERVARESNLENLWISATLHLEHTSIDKFLEKILLLRSHGVGVFTNTVAYPGYIQRMPEISKRFQEAGQGVAFYPYMGEFEGRTFPGDYSPEELAVMKDLVGWHQILERGEDEKIDLPRSKGAFCYTGVRFMFVDPRGTVSRCVQEAYNLGNVTLGSLFDGSFSLWEKPKPCPAEHCNCEVSSGELVLPLTVDCFRQHRRFRQASATGA